MYCKFNFYLYKVPSHLQSVLYASVMRSLLILELRGDLWELKEKRGEKKFNRKSIDTKIKYKHLLGQQSYNISWRKNGVSLVGWTHLLQSNNKVTFPLVKKQLIHHIWWHQDKCSGVFAVYTACPIIARQQMWLGGRDRRRLWSRRKKKQHVIGGIIPWAWSLVLTRARG